MQVTTGRAAVSFGPGRMELREYPVLPPEPDQALIRVSMATICRLRPARVAGRDGDHLRGGRAPPSALA